MLYLAPLLFPNSKFAKKIQKKRIAGIKARQEAKTERKIARKTGRLERKLAKRQLKATYDGKFQDLETGEQFTEEQVQEMGGEIVDKAGNVVKSYEGEDEERLTDDGVSPVVKIALISVGAIALITGTILVVRALNKNK